MNKNTNKETRILIFVLLACVLIASVLLIAVINALNKSPESPAIAPPPTHVEIENIIGLSIKEVKTILETVGIQYEIIPTESKVANRVEKIEFLGSTAESGTLLVEIGTTVKIYGNEVGKDKVIYLTFDDGPTQNNTIDILDTLDTYGIKATFFVIGNRVVEFATQIQETINRGHTIGCHSYTHYIEKNNPYIIYDSIETLMNEVSMYEQAMISVIGEEKFATIPKLFRFPGGSITNQWLNSTTVHKYLSALRENDYKIYDWTAETKDRNGLSTTEQFINNLSNELSSAKTNNKPLIVLMHDMKATKNALSEIIDYLIAEGYYFDTIDNCPEYTFTGN